jgi:retron-type reverse transcriptase
VKLYVESYLEPIFHDDSYGYRPGKSAHQALKACADRCQRYSWVLEIDISAFFDNVRHDLVTFDIVEDIEALLPWNINKAELVQWVYA